MLSSFSGTAQFIMFFCFIITNFCLKIQTMKTVLNTLFEFQTIIEIKKEKTQINTSNTNSNINSGIGSIKKIEITGKVTKNDIKFEKESDCKKI